MWRWLFGDERLCKWFGHKWRYNFTWMPNKRKCTRCGLEEKGVFKKHFHPIYDDPMEWSEI